MGRTCCGIQSIGVLSFKIYSYNFSTLMSNSSRCFWSPIRVWSCLRMIFCNNGNIINSWNKNLTLSLCNHWICGFYGKCHMMLGCLNYHFWTKFIYYTYCSCTSWSVGFVCNFKFIINWSIWCFIGNEVTSLSSIFKVSWSL